MEVENGAVWPNNVKDIPVEFTYIRNGVENKVTKTFNSSSLSGNGSTLRMDFDWSAPFGFKENIALRSYINGPVGGTYKISEKTWDDNAGFYGPIILPEANAPPPGFYFNTVDSNKTVVNGAMTDMITAANTSITDETKTDICREVKLQ